MPNSPNLWGIPRDNIKVAEDGELIQLTSETCEVFGREGRSGRVLVDGKPEFELEDVVLRDRIQLAEDGIVVPVIVLHSDTGDSNPEPVSQQSGRALAAIGGNCSRRSCNGGRIYG